MNKSEFKKASQNICEQLNYLGITTQAKFAAEFYSRLEKLIVMNACICTEDFIHCAKDALNYVTQQKQIIIDPLRPNV